LSIGCAGSKAVNTTTTTSTTSIVTPIVGNKLFDLAPEFKLRDLDGNTVSLSDFRGSPVLINFWRIN
jgi:cytochrome oxidase Cu insertion factor (SCO1/SenC/PrrC family)